jgi:hypothetical protein
MAGESAPWGFSPGRPGERYRNTSRDTHYQLVSSLRKPCASCLRRHGRILARPWPIPLHPNCQCDQLAILPGWDSPIESRTPLQTFSLVPPDAVAAGVEEATARRAVDAAGRAPAGARP